jgi:hypothetical protein
VTETLWRYADNVGVAFDRFCNALTGGDCDQTVSLRCAVAWRAGKSWGCVMCWLLDTFVQHDHCAHQFDDTPADVPTFLRAGMAFFFVLGTLYLLTDKLLRLF